MKMQQISFKWSSRYNKIPCTSESSTSRFNKSKTPHISLKDLESDNDATNSDDIAPGQY